MARLRGLLKFRGRLDKVSFSQTANGYSARISEGMDGRRISSDPSFARTRENNAEFGRAQAYSKVLRIALRELLLLCKDPRMSARLFKKLMEGLKADQVSSRGLRNITSGKVSVLEGFEFNQQAPLTRIFFGKYTTVINRASGELKIQIADHIPAGKIHAPEGTTHYQILSAGLAVDFEGGKTVADVKLTTELLYNESDSGVIELVHQVGPNSPYPLFLVLGFAFFQKVGPDYKPLSGKSFNALTVVGISLP